VPFCFYRSVYLHLYTGEIIPVGYGSSSCGYKGGVATLASLKKA